MATDIT